MGKRLAAGVIAGFHIVVVIAQFLPHIKQKGESMLGNRSRGIPRHIACPNPPGYQIISVEVIDPRRSKADQFQLLRLCQCFLTHGNFVRYNDIHVTDSFRHFLRGRLRVKSNFAQFIKRRKVHIRAQAVPLENCDFHRIFLFSVHTRCIHRCSPLNKKDFHITFYSEQYSKILPLSQELCPKEKLPHFSFSFFY